MGEFLREMWAEPVLRFVSVLLIACFLLLGWCLYAAITYDGPPQDCTLIGGYNIPVGSMQVWQPIYECHEAPPTATR